MSSQARPLESDGNYNRRSDAGKSCDNAHRRMHEQGYSRADAHLFRPQGDKNSHGMSLVDKHGKPVERIHHVKQGETVHSIARNEFKRHHEHANREQVGKFERKIIRANDLHAPYHVKAGQDLLIPKLHEGNKHKHPFGRHDSTGDGNGRHEKNGPGCRDHHRDGSESDRERHDREHNRQKRHPGRPDESAPGDQSHPRRRHEGPGVPGRPDSGDKRKGSGQTDVLPRKDGELPPDQRKGTADPGLKVVPGQEPIQGKDGKQGDQGSPKPELQRQREGDGSIERNSILSGKTVFIDVGHGGTDSGAVSSDGTKEKDITGLYAAQLKQKLEAAGVKVVLSRPVEDDPNLKGGASELQRRAHLADESHADVVIRIHANAGASKSDTSSNGLEAWWDQPKDQALTRTLHDAIMAGNKGKGLKDNGIKQKTEHYKFQPKSPSALIELGYITNPQERARLKDPAYRSSMTDSIVQGLTNYFQQHKQ